MVNVPLVPIIYARVLAGEVTRHYGDARGLLVGTGLDIDDAGPHVAGLTIAQYKRLLANVIHITGDTTVCLRAAAYLAPTIHGPVGIAASASPTLGTAIELLTKYICLRNPFSRVSLCDEGDYLGIEIDIFAELGEYRELALDFMISTTAATIPTLSDPPIYDFYIQLTRSKPENHAVYEEIIPCRIEYEQPANRLMCSKKELHMPLLGANEEVFRDAIARCDALYNLRHVPSNAVEAVNNQFMRMSGQVCSIGTVAEGLGMSGRTLQRRLKKLDVSYQALLDKWLSQEAIKYLIEEQLTVEVTAVLLGYADEANFRRAFKRWFGIAPGVYKREFIASNAALNVQ